MKTYKSALIIDDDVDLCLTLKSVLGTTIPTIITAHTLNEGVKALPELLPEIVFLDNNLPDGQGMDFVKEIKATSPGSFIIFITAIDAAKQNAIDLGVDVFLAKPLTYSSILGALAGLERTQKQL